MPPMLRRGLAAAPLLLAALSVAVMVSARAEVSALTEPTDELVNYETPHVHPIDLTPDGQRLLAVNTAAHRLEVFDVRSGTPALVASIPVGLDPVTVRARSNGEAWVVNHISDTVSVVDIDARTVERTLATDNEPADVVFADGQAFVTASEANAVNVFDLGDLSAAPRRIVIAGEDPRALAVSNDGSTVYAAIFESGNGTTAISGGGSVNATDVVSRLEGPYRGANPPPNNGSSLSPPLNPAIGTPPRNALIVREDDGGRWRDDNGGDWSIFVDGNLAPLTNRVVGWNLADNDVAVIDTGSLGVSYRRRVMNINMALAVNPVTDTIAVVGTDATNEIRFEPNLNGNFVRVEIGELDPAGGVSVNDLNTHLDYRSATVPPAERERSIGDPRGIAWSADGTRAFITGMGSNNVIVVGPGGTRIGRVDVGEGPTGIVVGAGDRAFVLNKFAGSISVVDTTSLTEVAEVAFYDPTPEVIKDGRRFLYDTHLTSGTGHVSCASCHVDARTDRLAWDLGNPAGSLDTVARLDGLGRPIGGTWTISPMKGPLLTQSLQDIIDFPTMHWRGDRADLGEFNPTFVNLMGRPSQFSAAEMGAFSDFLATIHLPPNPYRNIDGTRPARVTLPNGQTVDTSTFNALRGSNSRGNRCLDCHSRGNERNAGSNQELGQAFVPSAWVPWYDRLGYWPDSTNGSTTGFGFFHDGADDLGGAARTNTAERQDDMLAEIMTLEGPSGGLVGGERRQDTHAGVGQQVTIDGPVDGAESARLNQLLGIDDGSIHTGLVAKSAVGGRPRGWVHLGNGSFRPDRADLPTATTADLVAEASAGRPVTFTLVPAGTQQRLGIDIDDDGILDGDEDPITPQPGELVGRVTAADGAGVAGVSIDLFAEAPGGGRGSFLTSTSTGQDGSFRFEVEPSCYVLTFIAPGEERFAGSRWLQSARCVSSGERVTDIDAQLDGRAEAGVGGQVVEADGSGVADVQVDLFEQGTDGSRQRFLGAVRTGADGVYSFAVDPGCFVVTITAPTDSSFGGRRWFQRSLCVASGETREFPDAVVDPGEESALGGRVGEADGSPVDGVKVTFFLTGGDGARGRFIGETFTGPDGRYSFDVGRGCHWLVFVAPTGRQFTNGSAYLESFRCVDPGEIVTDLDATLRPVP